MPASDALAPALTNEWQKDVVKSYGGWTEFCHSYGLKPEDAEDREDAINILRGLAAEEEERSNEEGQWAVEGEEDEDEDEDDEEDEEDDDDDEDIFEDGDNGPPFAKASERKVVQGYGGWMNFCASFGLKPWDLDDVDEAMRIVQQFAARDEAAGTSGTTSEEKN